MKRCVWIGVVLILVGCSRTYYRKSADRETYPIIQERIVQPAYSIGRTNLDPAPTSRFADPTNLDFPPKPPDDPAAAIFMVNPGGQPGYRKWQKDGVIDWIEAPHWEEYLGFNEKGVLKLDQVKATEIALMNNRDYQTELENVYLAALVLTLNRFEYDLQWFASRNNSFTHIGGGSSLSEINRLTDNSNIGFTRNFAAGGQLLTNFANSFVWEFTGKSYSTSSSVGATLIQPLLRGFGRNFRLETLTQGERNVLYAVRSYARYRKNFWASINVDPGGYLQLLRQVQQVRNAQANIRSQEENYALYQRLFEGGRTQVANVDQVFQSLLTARSVLISAEINLQNSLDQYKLQLGLPPRFNVELDDTPLKRFILIDPDIEKLREEIDQFERKRKAELDAPPSVVVLHESVNTLRSFASRSVGSIDFAEKALKDWKEDLKSEVKPGEEEQRERAKSAFEQQDTKPAELRKALKDTEAKLKELDAQIQETNRVEIWKEIITVTRDVAAVVDGAMTAESQAKIYMLQLPELSFEEGPMLKYAHENRLDLQNALGNVTDSWRKVTVAANALQSNLTVRLDGNLATEPNAKNPFQFGAEGSTLAASVQFDGPLNRQAERNIYRASLIQYQRSRRAYIDLSDNVELNVRTGLRELRRLRVNFEIARQQLLVAVRQLAIERRMLTAPVLGNQNANDNGAATLRILNAQQSLLTARNGLTDSFFNYELQRIRLLINTEMLRLDDRGFPVE